MTFRGCGHKITTSTPRWVLRLQIIIDKLKYNFNHMYTKMIYEHSQEYNSHKHVPKQIIFIKKQKAKNEIKKTRVYDAKLSIKLMLIC